MTPSHARLASHADFRRVARSRLPASIFDYFDGGAGDEITLHANEAAFAAVHLPQRVMVDVSTTTTASDLVGDPAAMPLALAPVGFGGLLCRRGEVQAARAADRAKVPFCLSANSICSIEETARVARRPWWFQLYMMRDRDVVADLLRRAWDSGSRTLVFTVDLATPGIRRRDIRNELFRGTTPAKLASYICHPRWLVDVGLRGMPHTFGNLAPYVEARSLAGFGGWLLRQFDAAVTWPDIAWLRGQWRGRLVIKGILDSRDAAMALDAGADAIVVSNHGGRQLDSVAPTAVALPAIARAVDGRAPLLVDGGVRSGHDVLKALLLGADGVLIGRAWAYAAAAGGEAAIVAMLARFQTELRTAMALAGLPNVDAIRAMRRPPFDSGVMACDKSSIDI
ncbi:MULTISPECIES: L-lactate dehydrogenase [unclassified Sphingomonas]|uniref:L-lactate dehydrogenase n=1 Tax=unclassified Sphingomonas TaxID=196159 RepID=UPI0006F7B121|nr:MULTISPECIES: L-lactate dehydrogenase [unclassified Sphingomonas]KQX19651.1 alpha-hydroxy-acid oxidizing enzyme [Sphingomonas sp. Root1294]KQY65852.1 alpha-hydroxy-acid oxidizing enzyme [Sphingomonas sp. Root50]KRB94841.1 alpha-hydroxy-acid oxidizing enzyme [Sphingomonas sp. Root720]